MFLNRADAFSFANGDITLPYSDVYSDNALSVGVLHIYQLDLKIKSQEISRKVVRATPPVPKPLEPQATKQDISSPRSMSVRPVFLTETRIDDTFLWTGRYTLIRHRLWMPYIAFGYGRVHVHQKYQISGRSNQVTESIETERQLIWSAGLELMLYQTEKMQVNGFIGYSRTEGKVNRARIAYYNDYIPRVTYQGSSGTTSDTIEDTLFEVGLQDGSEFEYESLLAGASISYWYPIKDHSLMWTIGFDLGFSQLDMDIIYEREDIVDPSTPAANQTSWKQDQRVERSIVYRSKSHVRIFVASQYDVRQDVSIHLSLSLLRESGLFFGLSKRF